MYDILQYFVALAVAVIGGIAIIGILLFKVLQLNRTMKEKKQGIVPQSAKNGKFQKEGEGEPPPWAGGVDAKTTIFAFPTLLVKDSSQVTHQYRLNFEDFMIGRAGDNQLVIPKEDVAPHHARIVLNDNGYSIEDLGSKAGTMVNGERVSRTRPLSHMDKVSIGGTEILFRAS